MFQVKTEFERSNLNQISSKLADLKFSNYTFHIY